MRLIKKRKKWGGSTGGDIAIFLLLLFVGLFMMFPIYFSFIQSIKPVEELFVFPPKLYVQNPTSQNVFNSLFVSIVVTAAQLLFSSSAAYVLSKVRAPGVKAMNKVIEIALLFTSSVTYIVQYIVMAVLGMVDTYWAITLPYIATPMGLFLMKQFMGQIPESMIEAAKLDGASHMRICWQILMPNVKPAWLTLMIFAFQGAWQITGYLFVYSEQLKPIPIVMQQIAAAGIARAGVSSATVVILMLPPMILFLILQSNVVETMAHSGLKD